MKQRIGTKLSPTGRFAKRAKKKTQYICIYIYIYMYRYSCYTAYMSIMYYLHGWAGHWHGEKTHTIRRSAALPSHETLSSKVDGLCVHICVYIYTYIYICIGVSICIYIYRERERDISLSIYVCIPLSLYIYI